MITLVENERRCTSEESCMHRGSESFHPVGTLACRDHKNKMEEEGCHFLQRRRVVNAGKRLSREQRQIIII